MKANVTVTIDVGNLVKALAVVDLLRVSLANDFGAAIESNVGLTLIEAKQSSGVAACELIETLIVAALRRCGVPTGSRAAAHEIGRYAVGVLLRGERATVGTDGRAAAECCGGGRRRLRLG